MTDSPSMLYQMILIQNGVGGTIRDRTYNLDSSSARDEVLGEYR